MSQKVSRKTQNAATSEEKDKRQTDSPVKEMKKKLAANAEKEKQASNAEKTDKVDKSDKNDTQTKKPETTEKKVDNTKKQETTEKKIDKPTEKKVEKPAEKKVDKPADKSEKKADKSAEKKTEQAEKKEEAKNDKHAKPQERPKQNGKHTGTNGTEDNGTVSDGTDDDLVSDEMFPELAYDDNSDTEAVDAEDRSFTRRSQVKPTKTPETPRPASDKDDDSKILKLNEVVPPSDRKLRSADSPKPEKSGEKLDQSSKDEKAKDSPKKGEEKDKGKDNDVVIVEVEVEGESRVKTRARVSPYSRPVTHDHTATSVMANYTGNNTTMEMDITESSLTHDEDTLNDSGYLRGLRNIRGRSSYKHCDVDIQKLIAKRQARLALNTSAPEPTRPTAPVVGRKRKPENNTSIEMGIEVTETLEPRGKRMRFLESLTGSFRRTLPITLPRRQPEIVGINTDLPLTAPVDPPGFDPETLKPEVELSPAAPSQTQANDKRCVIM